ncbi:hypothetical protein [Saccharothrix syringae]|uniref:Secreted protein n=1 Tax=Saccharothrix syringae TaxID=103733 RepID=A0A5Q0GSX5_SACSY|nr:hypothetical protein [Saccharothrix syringae]QFZ17157.1 hypothetical protein EKG83_06475 [Saccharothrix syringae]
MITTMLAAACVLAAAACAKEEPLGVPSVSSASPTSEAAAAGSTDGQDAFTRCMKENGVDIEAQGTPDDENQPEAQGSAAPGDQRKQQEALDRCRRFLPDGGAAKPMGEEALAQAREFAKCMREKGVEYPDPDPNQGAGEGVSRIPEGIDINDPAIREKMADCSRRTNGLTPESTR